MIIHLFKVGEAPAELNVGDRAGARREVQRLIRGQLEISKVTFEGAPAVLYCDGDGEGSARPRNEAATAIYRARFLAVQPEIEPESLNAVYGDAVIVIGAAL